MSTTPSIRSAAREHSAARPQILLVEDDQAMSKLLAGILLERGYRVLVRFSASDVVHALSAGSTDDVRMADVDAVVTVHRMCGASGLDLAEAMRRAGWTGPIVVMSACADVALVRDAERLGVRHVLEKPYEVAELVRVVSACVPLDDAAPAP